ncbi:MAG: CxxxxCH/CxxCH domain-containing protein [Nitrospirae bacterium]|nr:CxxxxCH/CxxCH domain-containing protein [Nitrospirota bacterium]
MGFYINSTFQGGAYDGQTGVDYNNTVTTPPTTVSNTGTLQCSNIYCHSTGQGSSGGVLVGGDYKTPSWTGSVVCGDCHKLVMDSGSHTAHIGAPLSKTCSECHKNAGEGTALHANAIIEVAFNADPFSNSASYSQSPNTPGNGYGTCATVYCHSIGQGNGGTALVSGTSDYKAPAWGGTAVCGSCHDAVMASGSHTTHLAVAGYNCATCHTNAGSGTAKHADGIIDTTFNAAQAGGAGSYSQDGTPGNGYGTCSTVYCHGTISPQWGANTATASCEKCHGSAATAATGNFKDTAGNTSGARVGAHVAHLASTHNYTNDVACSQCHGVPAAATTVGHIDSALPAEVNVSRGYAAGTCSTTYCHGIGIKNGWPGGNNKTPSWGDTTYLTGVASNDCAQCHGYPPGGGHPGASPSTCKDCHPGVNPTGTGFTDPSLHVNGIVEATGGDDCNSCHTNANLSARHTVHTNPDAVLAGKKLSTSDYGNLAWWYSYSNVGGVPTMGCGYCHPQDSATHRNGTRNLNFAPNDTGAAGTLKAKNGTAINYSQNAGVSVTCSSVYCHSTGYNDGTGYVYQTTPDWYGGSFSGDKCSNCHGNSPNSGGKPGSLSHYNTNAMGMGVVGGHFVGIHYKNVFTGTTGVIKDGSNRQNAHGSTATSTTINCQTCHNSTVSMTGNDQNTVCTSCHTAPSKGTMSIDALSTTHINGTPDVVFAAGTINSKAQIRDDITTVTELSNSWLRNSGYKGGATSSDGSLTAASFNPATKSCSSVACHNGNPVTWAATNITCNSCHTSLP